VRRCILELLAAGENSAGAIVAVIEREFGISQSPVSQHLRVPRDAGFAYRGVKRSVSNAAAGSNDGDVARLFRSPAPRRV
jgi:DNA-binding transcriptional ArsR family regulator